MSDPRQAIAEEAGRRGTLSMRFLGWALGLVAWAVATDARPMLALLSLIVAMAIRGVYVITTSWGKGRSVFWSPWFFATAALCEVVWLLAR